MISRAAVIGHPVSHSLSPVIFELLAKRMRRALEYASWDVPPSELAKAARTLRAREWVGCNVTLPHKETIREHLDSVSPEAQAIGAVNVVASRRGRLHGFNTDAPAVERVLSRLPLPKAGSKGDSDTELDVLVFGAGGAAKAVCHALGKLGAGRVLVRNRTADRARALCLRFGRVFPGTRFIPASEPLALEFDGTLVVNATSMGMTGSPARFAFPRRGRRGYAFDLVYRPENTPFLEEAAHRGYRTIGGLEMLVWQALLTWEIWFDPIPPRSLASIRSALARRLRKELA